MTRNEKLAHLRLLAGQAEATQEEPASSVMGFVGRIAGKAVETVKNAKTDLQIGYLEGKLLCSDSATSTSAPSSTAS